MQQIISAIFDQVKLNKDQLVGLQNLQMNVSANTISIESAIEIYKNSIAVLEEMYGNGVLEQLPTYKLIRINQLLNWQSGQNVHSANRNAQQFINSTLQLESYLFDLEFHTRDTKEISRELLELRKLKRSYTDFMKRFDSTRKNLKFIEDRKLELQSLIAELNREFEDVHKKLDEARVATDSAQQSKTTIDGVLNTVQDSRKMVEDAKLGVTSFSENIEEYKQQIENIETRAAEIVAMKEKIETIKDQAHDALQLGSAVGISAAFSEKELRASNPKIYTWWLIGAGSFFFLALTLTAWIVTGWKINDPNSIGTIIGRIVAVGITIGAAVFCANQYVRQKNIAEDYAYKAVLSKSILAFIEEIEVSNDEKGYVGQYLTTVLGEIHKDPLRSRKKGRNSKSADKRLRKVLELVKTSGE